MSNSSSTLCNATRREFLNHSAKISAVSTLSLASAWSSYAVGGSDKLKLGLIGCGGRGTGAAEQAMTADDGTILYAMCDVDSAAVEKAHEILSGKRADRIDVPAERRYTGFLDYKKVIAECDVVILTTPPGFRPLHFEEAVAAGKHCFMEKPVATDVAGIKRVLAAGRAAKEKGLKVGVGLQRRHQPSYQEWIKRIHGGAIGDIILIRALWNGTARAGRPRLDGERELEYQIRNWYYFPWLSGDHNVEQHVHNIDVANWIMKDAHPVLARGMGGRQVRNKPEDGQIFDHHFVEYEYADGTLLYSQARQIPNCWRSISESATGTLGKAVFNSNVFTLTGPNADILRLREGENGHQLEHYPFFEAIRKNLDYNEAERGANSTMTGILGRMADYSGQEVRWEDAMASNQKLVPDNLTDFSSPAPVNPDADGRYPIPVPGVTGPFDVWY